MALSSFERAPALNPNDADIMVELADALMYAARPAEAVALVQKAIRLNPYHPDWYHWVLAGALYALERYEDAVLTVEQMPGRRAVARRELRAARAPGGGRQSAVAVLAEHPEFTIAYWAAMQPDAGSPGLAHFVEGLRKAGLPG